MTVAELVAQAQGLSVAERKLLIALLIDSLDVGDVPDAPRRRLPELRGLGKDLWSGVDAQLYVDALRNEWDQRA